MIWQLELNSNCKLCGKLCPKYVLGSKSNKQDVKALENSKTCCSGFHTMSATRRTKNTDEKGATIPLPKCLKLVVQGVLNVEFEAVWNPQKKTM